MREKPLLRGVSHQIAFFLSLIAGLVLLLVTDKSHGITGSAIYAVSLSCLLGVSAIYHRVNWKHPDTRAWMRRLDHTMIFVLIAGTYTPFALLNSTPFSRAILVAVWAAVVLGAAMKLLWISAPKGLVALSYVAVGLIGGLSLPEMHGVVGPASSGLIVVGGLAYILGALIYARKSPDPWPRIFGYHEIFHALVIVGAGLHYGAVMLAVRSVG